MSDEKDMRNRMVFGRFATLAALAVFLAACNEPPDRYVVTCGADVHAGLTNHWSQKDGNAFRTTHNGRRLEIYRADKLVAVYPSDMCVVRKA